MKKIIFLLLLTAMQTQAQCSWKSIAKGAYLVYGIKSDNTLWKWGHENLINYAVPPSQIGTANDWKVVKAGMYHILAIKNDGTLWAWGDNTFGQLGIPYNPNNNFSQPSQVGTDNDWIAITAGSVHSSAIKSNGTLWTWGRNDYGQLGNGSWNSNPVVTQVGTDTNWKEVHTSDRMMIALKTDNSLWAWGRNEYGGLGDGTTLHNNTPQQIGQNTNDWKSVSVSSYHSLALKNDGTLWAWGSNLFGKLGNGTTDDQLYPIQIGTDSDWKTTTVGFHHSVAIKNDGTLWSWGVNDYGQLGDGTNIDRHSPTQIGNSTDWDKLMNYASFNTFAIKTDQTLWGWGENRRGELLAISDQNNSTSFLTEIPYPIQNNCTLTLDVQDSVYNNEVLIYPNPSSDVVYITNTTTKTVNQITIYDISGKQVREIKEPTNKVVISDLSSGAYFVKLACENEVFYVRFVKVNR